MLKVGRLGIVTWWHHPYLQDEDLGVYRFLGIHPESDMVGNGKARICCILVKGPCPTQLLLGEIVLFSLLTGSCTVGEYV